MLDDGGKANEVLSPHACCKQKGAFLEGGLGEPFVALGKRFPQANEDMCQDFRAKG